MPNASILSGPRANPSLSDADQDLLIRLRAGDCEAYREAVQRYRPQMLGTARRIVGQSHAEDIVQDAWVSALRALDGFEGRAALATWLVRITTNKAISHLRSSSRYGYEGTGRPAGDSFYGRGGEAPPLTHGDAGSPDESLSAAVLRDCIDKHLARMPARQRAVVVMRDMEQRAIDDICNELGLSPSNVRVLLHRGRSKLSTMIKRYQTTGAC